MDNQVIIVCDDWGNPTGEYIPKEQGHTGKGRRHLAVCVLLENSKGEVLLQRRKHKIFDNIWDVSGATNNLHRKDGFDETFEEAAQRCLEEEYGVKGLDLKVMGSFNYFAKYGELCENEHCAIVIGKYNGEIKPNPQDTYEIKWVHKEEFLKDIEDNPVKYSRWSRKGVKILKEKGFFK